MEADLLKKEDQIIEMSLKLDERDKLLIDINTKFDDYRIENKAQLSKSASLVDELRIDLRKRADEISELKSRLKKHNAETN